MRMWLLLALLLLAIGVTAYLRMPRLPKCVDVGWIAGEWRQRINPEYPPAIQPWMADVRDVQCRDGMVRRWRGDPPPNRTSDGEVISPGWIDINGSAIYGNTVYPPEPGP